MHWIQAFRWRSWAPIPSQQRNNRSIADRYFYSSWKFSHRLFNIKDKFRANNGARHCLLWDTTRYSIREPRRESSTRVCYLTAVCCHPFSFTIIHQTSGKAVFGFRIYTNISTYCMGKTKLLAGNDCRITAIIDVLLSTTPTGLYWTGPTEHCPANVRSIWGWYRYNYRYSAIYIRCSIVESQAPTSKQLIIYNGFGKAHYFLKGFHPTKGWRKIQTTISYRIFHNFTLDTFLVFDLKNLTL